MTKETLARRVVADPRIEIYSCGQRDIRAGAIDRRVLATLEFLGLGPPPTVSALECGHSLITTSGNISEHSSGNAVDIAAGQRHPDRSATRARARSPKSRSAGC